MECEALLAEKGIMQLLRMYEEADCLTYLNKAISENKPGVIFVVCDISNLTVRLKDLLVHYSGDPKFYERNRFGEQWWYSDDTMIFFPYTINYNKINCINVKQFILYKPKSLEGIT